jgi:hypothetical protein
MFCPSCGTDIPDASGFCFKCGRSMSVAPNATSQQSPHVSGSRWPGRLAARLLTCVLAVFVVALAVYYLEDKPSTANGAKTTGANGRQQLTPLKTADQVKLSPADIASKYSDAVVVLENYNDQGQKSSQGSGFVFSSDGQVLTNYHVVRGASRMAARMHNQTIRDVEYVVGLDIDHDIAVLKIAGDGLPSVNLGNSSAVKAGDHVTVLGAPLGLESTLSDGIISAVRESGAFRLFQTSAPISHGSSGGPIFDDYGNVVGLAVAILEAGENLNFAVPIDSAKTLIASERQTSFAELLSMTTVRQPILTSSISIPPQVMTLDIPVPPQGGTLAGSFSIAGGLGNDLGISLASDNGTLVWNGGTIKNFGNLSIRLRGGRYRLVLNNKMGAFWVASKTISGTIELAYYR